MTANPIVAIVQALSLRKQVQSPEGPLTIIDDVSLAVQRGETVAVLGVSGSGKSTLLALLAGLDAPTSGRVVLDGTDLSAIDEDGRARLRAQRVGFVFQSFHLLPGLNAVENVMLPLELGGTDGNGLPRERAALALERVGLAARRHHYPSQLSGGEQQRVALARAFVTEPSILFADEPTGNLDSRTAAQVVELLFDLNHDLGATVVVVTHDPTLAGRCDRRLHLDAGRLAPGPT